MTKFPVQLLMILIAALSAFTLPEAKSSVRETIQGLFVPVALPSRAIGRWASERLSPPHETDIVSPNVARSNDELRRQNAELVTRLMNLEAQLDDLKQLSAQYDQLGTTLKKMVQPATIVAGPVLGRQTLTISTARLAAIRENMAVVHPLGVVGQIYAVAPGGATARVLLLTDPHSHVQGRFVRMVSVNGVVRDQPIKTPAPMVDGTGTGLSIGYLAAHDVRGVVQIGDIVLLDDARFPPQIKGLPLGRVRAITLPPNDSGHATIAVDPTADFSRLAEVLVVDK